MSEEEEVIRRAKDFLDKKSSLEKPEDLVATATLVQLILAADPSETNTDNIEKLGYSSIEDLKRDYDEAVKFYGLS